MSLRFDLGCSFIISTFLYIVHSTIYVYFFPEHVEESCCSTPIPAPTPSTSYFPYRPPITFEKRTVSQRKSLRRKHLYAQRYRIPRSASNPACARIRLRDKEARLRRKQLKTIADLKTAMLTVRSLIDDADRATISLLHFIGVAESIHKISCTLPRPQSLKRPCSPDTNSTLFHSLSPPFQLASVLDKRLCPP
jgi:hypothetical protein